MESSNLKWNPAGFKDSMTIVIPRPVITNSRVKQDEKYRKDMYLAFVNNALLQKSKVSLTNMLSRAQAHC